MTLEELKAMLPEEKHAELDTLIGEVEAGANPLTGITDEGFTEQLSRNPDLQKVLDKRMSTGLESWKKNNLEKHVSDEYEKRYAKEHPDETEEQKRIKALEIESKENKTRADRAELRTSTVELMTEKKLPSELLDMAMADDLETTTARVNSLAGILETQEKSITEKILKENGRVITETEDNAAKYFTAEQIMGMSPQEQFDNQGKVDASLSFLASQQ